jgi:type II secretory pathway component GspD/PulD (secretin)
MTSALSPVPPPVKPLILVFLLAATSTFAAEPTVTLDVKDEDVHVILKSMQKQCGIKNLLIDKDVTGSGTIYFREVSCETAFRTVFKQFGLTGQVEQNMVTVEPRSN